MMANMGDGCSVSVYRPYLYSRTNAITVENKNNKNRSTRHKTCEMIAWSNDGKILEYTLVKRLLGLFEMREWTNI